MPNKYANLTGTNRISDEYQSINEGFDSVEADINEVNTKANAAATHAADKQNPHNTSKTQVGLGSVDNYATANQTQAQAGTATNAFMTPQRTKQAIDALAPATAPVQSVAGRSGSVTLTTDDIAETSKKKIMTDDERTKLSGIKPEAEPNQNAYSTINGIAADTKQTAVTFKGGTGISVTQNASSKEVTITATGTSTPGAHASSHQTGGSDPIPVATAAVDGLMSKEQVAALGNKLDKNNPSATGTYTLGGRRFSRVIGNKPTIISSPHQKLEIEIPKHTFSGYFDISVGGGYNNNSASGIVKKRFYGMFSIAGSKHGFDSKYIEVAGAVGSSVRIGELTFDSTKDKYVIKVSCALSWAGQERLYIEISGINTNTNTGDSSARQAIEDINITEFYADSEVLPAPKIQIDTELHNGWRRYNNAFELGLDNNTATIQQIINAMPDKSVSHIQVNSTNSIALGFDVTEYGMIVVDRQSIERVVANFYSIGSNNRKANISNAAIFLSWEKIPLSNKTLQTDLNADMVDGLHATYGATANTIMSRDTNADTRVRQIQLTAATGVAPMSVSSTTMVNNLNSERSNGIKTFNSLTTPVGASNGDVWFPPPS